MDAIQYKTTRERLGMTQAALAVALGVSRKTINERETKGRITREAAMALELLALRATPKRRKGTNSRIYGPSIESRWTHGLSSPRLPQVALTVE